MVNLRKDKGSISVLVAVTVIFVVATISGAYVVNGIRRKAQLETQIATKETFENQIDNATYIYAEVAGKDQSGNQQWDTTHLVNIPQLVTGMTPIRFTDVASDSGKYSAFSTTEADEKWYDYDNKKWANAQTEDGSMWVWIPRFAYKINSTNKTVDVVFLIGTTDKYIDPTNGTIQIAQRNGNSSTYIVHPAFTDESKSNYTNGGWDKELTGIWVAKFEAGYASANNTASIKASSLYYSQTDCWAYQTETNTGSTGHMSARNWLDGIYGDASTTIKYPTFQGSTYSMNYISIGDTYSLCKILNETGNIYGFSSYDSDTHLMKNSEWGAVAYLSKSKYGVSSANIDVNTKDIKSTNSSLYAITGYNKNQEWNAGGQTASTTNNIYGIYDICGGLYERVASYITNGNAALSSYCKDSNNNNFVATTVANANGYITLSTKYVTVYPYNKSSDTEANNWTKYYGFRTNIYGYGDAILETSTAGNGFTSWNNSNSSFPNTYSPIFNRGGSIFSTSVGSDVAGITSFATTTGCESYNDGFRAIIIKN